jgi:Spy/CpxP family protein refolding chaperone
MTPRLTLSPLFALAAFALCGTITLAQQTPAQQTPAVPAATAPAAPAAAPAAAPIERQTPPGPGMGPGMGQGMGQGMHQGMRPGMDQGMRPGMRPGMQGNFRANMMRNRGNARGGFRGAQGGGLGAGFHIAPGGMWWKRPMVVQRLALTPEQTKKMDGIFEQSRLQLIDLKANLEKQNTMLEPLLSANPPDTAKALAQIDKVAEARAELEKADARMLLGIRGVLTPEQWTKLHEGRGAGGFSGPEGPGGAGHGPGGPGGNHLVAPVAQP